jgi:ataxin 2/2L
VPHCYQNGTDDKKIDVETVKDNLIIKLCDIVTIHAKDVDLDYAVRDTFQTDTAISSRSNGSLRNTEKKLQPWMDGADGMNGDMGISLELDTQTNGWDANEMFQLNEKEHGIKTTFKDNLESYTVQLDKDSNDFRKQELEAERIANEIENNPMTKDRLDLENGDEEAAFAAVVRPTEEQTNPTGTTNSNTVNDKMTPPPASAQKYIPQQQQQQKRPQQDRKMMPTNTKPMYSKPMQTSGPGQHGMQPSGPQQAVQQTINAGGFKTMTINPVPQYTHQPPPPHYAAQQQQIHNQQGLNNNNDGKMNGQDGRENNNNKQPMPPRNMRIMNATIPVSFNEPPPPLNQVAGQHMGKPPTMGIHMPPPHLQNPDGQQAIHVVTQQQVVLPPPTAVVVTHGPPPLHMHPAPQPQRPPREQMMRSRGDDIQRLRSFHNDFNLGPAGTPGQQQNVLPQVPNSQQQQVPPPRSDMQDNGQNPMSHPPPTQNVEMGKAQHTGAANSHANNHQHIQHHPTPSSTPHADKSHGPSSTPPQATTPQSVNNVNSSNNSINSSVGNNSNSSESTPPSASSSNEKPSLGAKKFTLNPQAKPFTPRSPSTPTQSR